MKGRSGHRTRAASNREHAPPARPASRSGGVRWWAAVLGVLAVGLTVWQLAKWWQQQAPQIEVPAISLEQASPAVAELVQAAREEVLASPRSATAWGELGMVLLAHQFEFEANTCLAQAQRLDSDEFRWPYLLGVSLAVSDPRAAEVLFRRAIDLRADYPVAHVRLAELLLVEGKLEDASVELEIAIQGDPQDPRTHYDIAQLMAARGDPAAALPWAVKAADLAPDVRIVHDLLANLQRQLGDQDRARDEVQRAGQASALDLPWRDPVTSSVLALRQDVSASMDYAQALLDQGRVDDAISTLRRGLEQDNRSPTIYTTLARTLIQANRLREAEEVLQQAEQRHPQSAEVHFQRGILQFMAQRYDDAERSFREAVRCQPNYALAHYNLGHALLKQGQEDAALDAFAATLALRPDYADAHTNLAKILLRRGEKNQAADHLRQARRLKPQDAEVRQLLAQLDVKESEGPK